MKPTSRARFVAGYFELLCGDLGLSERDRLRIGRVADLAVRDYHQQDPTVLFESILARVHAGICERSPGGATRYGRIFTIQVVSDDLFRHVEYGLRQAGIPELIALASVAADRDSEGDVP